MGEINFDSIFFKSDMSKMLTVQQVIYIKVLMR